MARRSERPYRRSRNLPTDRGQLMVKTRTTVRPTFTLAQAAALRLAATLGAEAANMPLDLVAALRHLEAAIGGAQARARSLLEGDHLPPPGAA